MADPLTDSDEHEIAAALAGRPRSRTSAERGIQFSTEIPEPPPSSSASESTASAEAITSEDAERALAELDSIMGAPDLPPPVPSDPEIPPPAPRAAPAPAIPAPAASAPPPPASAGSESSEIDGGWKRVGTVGGGRLGKSRTASGSGSGGTPALAAGANGSAPGAAPLAAPANGNGAGGNGLGVSTPPPGASATPPSSAPPPSSVPPPSSAPHAPAPPPAPPPPPQSASAPSAAAAAALAALASLATPPSTGGALPPPPAPPPPPSEDDEQPLEADAEDGGGERDEAGAAEDDEAPQIAAAEEEDDARGAYPEPPPLPVVQGDDEEAAPAKPAEPTSEHDLFLGELARLQRFVTAEQVAEAVRVSQKLRAEGRPKKIGKIMVKLGHLTATQAKYLLKLQRTPDPIEGYKLLERRGQGGMGVVYRAVQKSMRREVALKILAPKWAAHARFLQRFFREAKLAGTLNHPNIVSAIDVGECNGLHYYAMEYVDGWSIAEMLKEDGPFDEDEALDIVLQVAKGLKEASAHAIIHRDVKPENILVTPDGVAKLADLGLSKQLTSDCSITTEGKTLGTPFYVSPELARGQRDVDVRSDIYSLGATLYHMLTGRPPFEGDQPAMIMARHIAEAHVPARRVRPDLSQTISKLVDRMMAKDPAKRYAGADDLMRDVAAIRKGKNPFAPQGGRSSGGGGGRSERAERTERAGGRRDMLDSDSDSASARMPAQPSRRVTTAPERPAYGAGGRSSAQSAGIAAAVIILLCAVAVVAILAKNKSDAAASGASSGASASASSAPEVGASTPPAPPAPPPVHVSPERERTAQMRWAATQAQVRKALSEGKYDEAARAADLLALDVAGTAVEGDARELKERIARETRTAAEMALKSARRALSENDPARAKDFLDGAPKVDAADIAADRARLREEIERALRK